MTGEEVLYAEAVEGLGLCLFLRHSVDVGAELLREAPLLFAPPGAVGEDVVEEALALRAEEGESRGDEECWGGALPLWSGAALSATAARHLLGLLAAYAASTSETRCAVLELDDGVEPGPAAALLRQLADLAAVRGLHPGVRRPEARCVLRIAFANAFSFGPGAALFALASRFAHGCSPNAFYSSEEGCGRVVALQALPQGARVSLCYVPRHYALLPKALRRRFLRLARGFTCRCDLCEEEREEDSLGSEPVEALVAPLEPAEPAGAERPSEALLHICCCVVPLPGHLLPMLRIARALASLASVGRVTYLSDSLGAARVQAWLEEAPDLTGKIALVGFEDGYDAAMDAQMRRSLVCKDEAVGPDMNLLIEANVGVHLQRLIYEDGVDYFLVDWYSYGFSRCLETLEAELSVSMPTSPPVARECLALAPEGGPEASLGSAGSLRSLLQGRPVLLHCLPEMMPEGLGAEPAAPALPRNFRAVGLVADARRAESKGSVLPEADASRALEAAVGQALSDFLSAPGPPVVYVCMGTLAHLSAPQLQRLADGLRAPGEWRVLWALEEGLQARLPADLGEDFLVVAWAPQLEVLAHPRCAAACLHAGWGSACEAIACGKPICALPLYGDHAINAGLLTHMGVCKVVGVESGLGATGHFPLDTFSPDGLREDLRGVVEDPRYLRAARRWQQAAAASPPGALHAAELIEGFARSARESRAARPRRTAAPPLGVSSGGRVAEAGFAASAVTFAEDPAPLSFEDEESDEETEQGRGEQQEDEPALDFERLPRGARLEILLLQSTALLGQSNGVTEWLLRLRVYRDFARLCGHGAAVIGHLDPSDIDGLVRTTAAVHESLLRRAVPLGLASPALEGEPHRPQGFARRLLAVGVALVARLPLPGPVAAAGPEAEDDGPAVQLLEKLLAAAGRAVRPRWWDALEWS